MQQYIDAVHFTSLLGRCAGTLRQLPSQCAICHGWGRARVCAASVAAFAAPLPRCLRCALQVPAAASVCGECLKAPPAFDAALAAVDYDHPWDQVLARFKFNAALDLAAPLAELLLHAHRRSGAAHPGLLLPVPLSVQRLRERGYNQAWELARRLRRALACPADPHLLLRVKHTPHQISLPREQRAANVRGAFAVEPLRRHELRGRHVTLVDDVMTSAATLGELAHVLRQAGAAGVQVWVVARTARPGG